MSAPRLALLCLLALFSIGDTTFAQSTARGGSPLLSERTLSRFGLVRRWWGHATINPQRDRLVNISADEHYLFVQTTSGIVTTFDAETGLALWSRPMGQSDRGVYAAGMNDDLLFMLNGMNLLAIRKVNGDLLWELALPGEPASSPAADEQRIYVGFLDGSMYAFDLMKTKDLYSKGMLPQFANDTVAWRYQTSKPISVPAVPEGRRVAFASGNGSLYSVTADDRRLNFQFETDAPLSAPLARYRNKLLVASQDSNFYELDATSGRQGWQFTTGRVIKKAPVLIGDEVYLIPEYGSMYKLSADTGAPYWSRPRINDFLAASTDRIYAVDRSGGLAIMDRATGKPLGGFSIDRYKRYLTNDRSDRIFLATETGIVVCLHEGSRDFPRFHLHPERQPILPEFAPEGSLEESTEEMPTDEMPAEDQPAGEKPADDEPAADETPAAEETPAEEKSAEEGAPPEAEELPSSDDRA